MSQIVCKDKDWKLYQKSCYKLFEQPKYYDTANSLCKHLIANLINIDDENENQFAKEEIANISSSGAWINQSKTNFQSWNEYLGKQYTNWVFRSPSGSGNCIQMLKGGKWNNVGCLSQYPFICEKSTVTTIAPGSPVIWPIPITLCVVMLLFVSSLFIRNFCQERLAAKKLISNSFQSSGTKKETLSSNKKHEKNMSVVAETSKDFIGCINFSSSYSPNETRATNDSLLENDSKQKLAVVTFFQSTNAPVINENNSTIQTTLNNECTLTKNILTTAC
ncbi:aggrecan core protein [Hydra vulgaris]|uniref:Aggrecan core protein n=1 Tax=Hydra vulgaris TaxID=6087 RepID=A0ABM4BJR5_HYDVU